MGTNKLDVVSTLCTAVRAWWIEFAPVTLLGLMLVTLPSLALTAVFGPGAARGGVQGLGTVAATLLAVLNLLYFCSVAVGILSGLSGRRLDPRTFMTVGLRSARPGLEAALLLAIGLVVSASFFVASEILGGVAVLFGIAAIGAILWGLVALVPSVPAAIAERRRPFDALRRAMALTRGQRWRLLGLFLAVALALLPPLSVVNAVVFGASATPEAAADTLGKLTLADPRLWIAQLSNLLVTGLLACLPPVIYVELVRLKGGAGRPSPA